MGCNSSKATATATVSPTRAPKQSNDSIDTSTTGTNHYSKTQTGRQIALKKVGEESFMSNLVQQNSGSITADYHIDESQPLGTGMTCTVKLITHRTSGKKYALKAIRLNRLQQDKIDDLRREIEIMKALDHPNIIKLYQTFEDHSYIYMVMELCTGGELFDRLADQQGSKFTEPKAADLITKMLSSLNYIHLRHVCHRDLKLENFIFENEKPDAEIKLIDFGLSKVYLEGQTMHNVLGTSYYVAPEVLAGSYGIECDLWGLGVLAYMMLSGQAPFSGDTDKEILKLVKIGKYDFLPKKAWRKISDDAQDFISKLLVQDPKDRMTASEALQHPWITNYRDQKLANDSTAQNSDELAHDVYDNLQSYRKFAKLKRAALIAIAYTLSQDDIEASRTQFERLDVAKNGFITLDQLRTVLESQDVSDAEVEKMFNDIDQDHSGTIDYSEFIAAAMQKRIYLDEERLHDAFHRLDVEGTGFLTVEGLTKILGGSFSPEEVAEMVAEADFNHDGKIAFDQFQKLMRDDVPASPGGKGSPLMRKRTAKLGNVLDDDDEMISRSPSRPRRRPSQLYTRMDLENAVNGKNKHLLPIQIDDRSVQLGAPSPLMKQGKKSVVKTSPESRALWAENTIPEGIAE